MRWRVDAKGRWIVAEAKNAPQKASEGLSNCEPTGRNVSLMKNKAGEGGTIQKAKVRADYICTLSEDENELVEKANALALEADELMAAAQEQNDEIAMEALRQHFQRWMRQESKADETATVDDEDAYVFNKKHKIRFENKRRGQRLKH